MGTLLKILAAFVPLCAIAAYVASKEVRAAVPLGVLIGLIPAFWVLLLLIRLVTVKVPPEQLEAMQREHGFAGGTEGWVPARATIAQFRNTGMRRGRQLVVEFELQIAHPQAGAYPARHRQTVPELAQGRIAPGVALSVRINPSDGQQVFIDWEQTFPGVTARPLGSR